MCGTSKCGDRSLCGTKPISSRLQCGAKPMSGQPLCERRLDVVQVKPVRRRGKPDVAAKVGGRNNKKALKTRFAGLSHRFI